MCDLCQRLSIGAYGAGTRHGVRFAIAQDVQSTLVQDVMALETPDHRVVVNLRGIWWDEAGSIDSDPDLRSSRMAWRAIERVALSLHDNLPAGIYGIACAGPVWHYRAEDGGTGARIPLAMMSDARISRLYAELETRIGRAKPRTAVWLGGWVKRIELDLRRRAAGEYAPMDMYLRPHATAWPDPT